MNRAMGLVAMVLLLTDIGFAGEIIELPVPDGAQTSLATGVSADGSIVVGNFTTPSGNDAFVWKENEGVRALGRLPGAGESYAAAVSADGRVIVGTSGTRGFRWTADEGMAELGIPDGVEGVGCNGVSADGSVIVGFMRTSDRLTHAMVWTAANGLMVLGTDSKFETSEALAISSDGTAIVGWGTNPDTRLKGLIWRRSGAPPETEGCPTYRLEVVDDCGKLRSVSADGSRASGDERFFARIAGIFQSGDGDGWRRLGWLPGDEESYGYAISDDGALVAGSSFSGPGKGRAFLWDDHIDEESEARPNSLKSKFAAVGIAYAELPPESELLSVLGKEGIDGVGRWTNLVNPTDLSGDAVSGYNIVGQGLVDGHQRVFLVRGFRAAK